MQTHGKRWGIVYADYAIGQFVYAQTRAALKLAMRTAGFRGRADTEKLITAFEEVPMPEGPDFPGESIMMNKGNHQGRMTFYVLKIEGQQAHVLQAFPAQSLPNIGDCKVASN